MNTIKWIGLIAIAASVAGYGCSSNPSQSNIFSSGDDSGGGSSTPGDDGGNGSSGGSSGASSGSTSSSNGGGSSGSNGGSGGGSNGGSSSGTGSSGGSGSSGASSSSSSGGLITGEAGMDNPDIDYSVAPVTISMTPFTVAAGAEVYYCQNFANPWGKQVDIKTYSLNMSKGSHHMFAFYQTDATNGTNAPCPSGGLTFAPFTFSAQQPTAVVTYPATVGATLPSSLGFQINAHYINTGASDITATVSLTMWVAKPNVVTNHAGALFLNQAAMTVAASCTTATGGCQSSSSYTLPQDVYILTADSHMHQFATNFIATTSTGVTLFQTTQWAEPPAQVYSPPLMLPAGTTITWTCTDVNNTGAELTFGEHAATNVMCISSNIFYPVSTSSLSDPVLGTQL
jgi:hypothetical protein